MGLVSGQCVASACTAAVAHCMESVQSATDFSLGPNVGGRQHVRQQHGILYIKSSGLEYGY